MGGGTVKFYLHILKEHKIYRTSKETEMHMLFLEPVGYEVLPGKGR
jgi:hypothetical protein